MHDCNNFVTRQHQWFKRQRAVFENLLYQTIRQPVLQSSEQAALLRQVADRYRCSSGHATEASAQQANLSQTNNSKRCRH